MISTLKKYLKDKYRFFKSPKVHHYEMDSIPASVLFICKGNICRSPFAEHLAKKMVSGSPFQGLVFQSAGLRVIEPIASPFDVISVAETFGCDLKNHVSRHITRDMASSVDLIACMETWHVACLRDLFPEMENKILLLSRFEKDRASSMWSYSNDNILDPYGKTISHYLECFKRIERCIEGLLLDFQKLSSNGQSL